MSFKELLTSDSCISLLHKGDWGYYTRWILILVRGMILLTPHGTCVVLIEELEIQRSRFVHLLFRSNDLDLKVVYRPVELVLEVSNS